MFSLKSRQDQWRLLFPKHFIVNEIYEKYANILKEKHSFIENPIDFLNETIQSVQVLGFSGATMQQPQTARGTNIIRKEQNSFLHAADDFNYRSENNPVKLIDKTLNITFRHTLGFVNYFLLFENFFWIYSRNTEEKDLLPNLYIDIPNEHGEIYCRIELQHPVIDTMDMLDLSYANPISESQTFQVQFKYSNIDFQFISNDEYTN